MTLTPTLRHLVVAAAALLAIGAAQASNYSDAVYKGAKTDVKANYKAEREACKAKTGNAKDVCVEIAKAHDKVAMAYLDFNRTGLPADEMRLYKAQYEAIYDVSKEQCDDMKGQDKDVCVRSAKTTRDKAKSELKMSKKVVNATDTAMVEHMKADFKLAKEKCDSLSGDPKDICMASAKARYNERW